MSQGSYALANRLLLARSRLVELGCWAFAQEEGDWLDERLRERRPIPRQDWGSADIGCYGKLARIRWCRHRNKWGIIPPLRNPVCPPVFCLSSFGYFSSSLLKHRLNTFGDLNAVDWCWLIKTSEAFSKLSTEFPKIPSLLNFQNTVGVRIVRYFHFFTH